MVVAHSHIGAEASRSPAVVGAFGIVVMVVVAGSRAEFGASSGLASVVAAPLAALAVVVAFVVRVSFSSSKKRVMAGQLGHPTGYQLEAIIVARWRFRSCSRSRANSLGSLSGIAIHRL